MSKLAHEQNKYSQQTKQTKAIEWSEHCKPTNGASEQASKRASEQASGLLEMRQDTRPENEREREIHYNMYY